MPMPQFSMRQLLVIVTLAGALCLVPALAAKGFLWTLAPLTALAAAFVFLLLGAVLFVMTGGVVAALGGFKSAARQRPHDQSE
jgi:hypothetical protein